MPSEMTRSLLSPLGALAPAAKIRRQIGVVFELMAFFALPNTRMTRILTALCLSPAGARVFDPVTALCGKRNARAVSMGATMQPGRSRVSMAHARARVRPQAAGDARTDIGRCDRQTAESIRRA
jgi:hypothetical protein